MNCFTSNTSGIFAISTFEKFDAAFTIACSINTQHTQISYVDAKLFNCTAPERPVNMAIYCSRWGTHLKVSHAAISTRSPFWINQKQTFDRFVLLPTPFTPTKVMLYGRRCWLEARGADNLVRIDSKRSVEVFGVNIRVSEVDRAWRTALLIAKIHAVSDMKGTKAERTYSGNRQLFCQSSSPQHLRRPCQRCPSPHFSS